ncbi:hypothetical protein GCM10010377_68390 [Streptomyces viridiviolaceus]|uniref:Uncharacterized protein n=1 Tax=Streptomyces viridiviolaceus TaxID=68282 RepID=A0ABW2E9R3_9ACTN|nr:hypothetical protein [Streptomyces viridiviolaceus]GHB67802.1 hypothetical protein GCM10010377_68390 [Streptomyces viridiviolaceus]
MTADPPARRRPRAIPDTTSDDTGFDDLLQVLGEQLGEAAQTADPRSRRKLKNVSFEYEPDHTAVHDMAGGAGYSLASNWFTQLLAQLAVANSITKSQLCVFLWVAGGQERGTGIARYTQQEITDGLNELAKKKGGKRITRSTVNRAIRALVGYKWVEQLGNGLIQLNVRLWFHGNSNAQHAVLEQIAVQHGHDAEAFPHGIGPDVHQQELELDFTQNPHHGRGRRTG